MKSPAYLGRLDEAWRLVGVKADGTGLVWRVWEKGGIYKRVAHEALRYPRTLYWRRGAFTSDGAPRWVRQLKDA
jgi:hypothetical protein